jgi:hypothetical protein
MVARAFAALLALGCSIPEAEFPDEVAATYCDRIWTCDPDSAQDIYGNKGDCEDFWSAATEAWLDVSDFLGQEYVPEEGPECVRSIRWASCDDIEDLDLSEECYEVLE